MPIEEQMQTRDQTVLKRVGCFGVLALLLSRRANTYEGPRPTTLQAPTSMRLTKAEDADYILIIVFVCYANSPSQRA